MSALDLDCAKPFDSLVENAAFADQRLSWPEKSWKALLSMGGARWSIPSEYGGEGLSYPGLLTKYEEVAQGCLTTAFLLSQRDAAVRRLRDCARDELRIERLSALARGDCFATVGLSQLSTSRQHGQPALRARKHQDGFVLQGEMPWVTGAPIADFFVTGAAVDDGSQILAVVPRACDGIKVEPPFELMALQGSLTTSVRCQEVFVPESALLAGPAERIMNTGKGGTGGLETSCLALGLTKAATTFLLEESTCRPDLAANAERLEQARIGLRQELMRLASEGVDAEQAGALRAKANSLVVRAAQATLIASKGNGYLHRHPAQRWVRQAHFFYVWSCPRNVAEAALQLLSPSEGGACGLG